MTSLTQLFPWQRSAAIAWARLVVLISLTSTLFQSKICSGTIAAESGTRSVYALLIIDVQNCFMSNGSLPVVGGEEVVPVINDIRDRYRSHFEVVAISQDWHCVDHVSFTSQHAGFKNFDRINLTYVKSTGDLCRNDATSTTSPSYTVDCSGGLAQDMVSVTQDLWPDHCIQKTAGARLHPSLKTELSDVIVLKGFRCQIDSYSAFYDNGRINITSLHRDLTARGITDLFVVGLATDYCVFYSAMDAKELGYTTWVILDATRGITLNGTERAVNEMKSNNIKVVSSAELDSIFNGSNGGVLGSLFTLSTSVATSLILTYIIPRLHAPT